MTYIAPRASLGRFAAESCLAGSFAGIMTSTARTPSAIGAENRVLCREFVSVLAVCQVTVRPAVEVLKHGDSLKMIGVDTRPIATQVVNRQSLGDWPLGAFVIDAVGQQAFLQLRNPQETVSDPVGGAQPVPAAIFVNGVIGSMPLRMALKRCVMAWNPFARLSSASASFVIGLRAQLRPLATAAVAETKAVGRLDRFIGHG